LKGKLSCFFAEWCLSTGSPLGQAS
jgi:hypothetical protein